MNNVKSDYIAENLSLLTNLTWKELETIYYLHIPSLKDYGKSLSEDSASRLPEKSTRTAEKQPVTADIKPAVPASKPAPPIEPSLPASGIANDTILEKTSEITGKESTGQRFELGIAQTIQKHLREHISTSPFAKLKSNLPAIKEQPANQPALSTSTPIPIPAPIPAPTLAPAPVKPLLEQKQTPQESKGEPKMESAWFIEPAQPPVSSSQTVNADAEKQPEKSTEVSLDTAIENAFGRMLKLPKKKTSEPATPVGPLAVPAPPEVPAVPAPQPEDIKKLPDTAKPEPKLLSYSKTNAESAPLSETISSRPVEVATPDLAMQAAFDFSPAEDFSKNALPLVSASTSVVETGEHEAASPLDIKSTANETPSIESPDTTPTQKISAIEDTYISTDVLRNLIHNHIKNASGQSFDPGAGQSIGSGKEFEVWLNNPARSKFIGGSKANEPATAPKNAGSFKPRIVPADIRKSCLILGLRPEALSYETVQEAWKKSIALPGVHPDQGGDTEMAVYLNTAKDILTRWLDAQAPKLGKRFGAPKKDDTK